jgi:MoaA/NifB/PqqE/SkfB family radical SAM enzyme
LADNDSLVDDYTGQRAYQWIKEQLGIKSFERVNYTRRDRQGFYYNIIRNDGKVMSCPFTGYYADDYFLYNLLNDIKEGFILKEAFFNLADCAARIIEDELEFQQSEENFIDYTESNEIFFDENGKMFK